MEDNSPLTKAELTAALAQLAGEIKQYVDERMAASEARLKSYIDERVHDAETQLSVPTAASKRARPFGVGASDWAHRL